MTNHNGTLVSNSVSPTKAAHINLSELQWHSCRRVNIIEKMRTLVHQPTFKRLLPAPNRATETDFLFLQLSRNCYGPPLFATGSGQNAPVHRGKKAPVQMAADITFKNIKMHKQHVRTNEFTMVSPYKSRQPYIIFITHINRTLRTAVKNDP